MALLLRRRDQVKPDDLPYIEAAYFTAVKVKSERHKTFGDIMNLKHMLYEVDKSSGIWDREERQWRRLLELIERYEVVLVGGPYNRPLSPVFRWKADETQPQGGSWENTSQHSTNRNPLNWLLDTVHASHGGSTQAAAATTAAATVASAATAVAERLRTPAMEEKRYTLVAILSYQHLSAVKNTRTSFHCKLEHEFTGPESRRSGEIQKTDSALRDLSHSGLRQGGYTLAFQKSPRAVRSLEPKQ